MTVSLHIRRLGPDEAELFRAVRLEALRAHPDAFGASYEIETDKPLSSFAQTLANCAVFSAWRGEELLGVASFWRQEEPKERHKGLLWGLYVRQEARGSGAADRLVEAVIDHARKEVESLSLAVGAHNAPAQKLYRRHGFVEYGREPRALKVGEAFYDEIMMRLVL